MLGLRSHLPSATWLIGLMIVSALTEGIGLVLLVPMLTALGGGSAGGRIGEWLAAAGVPVAPGPLLTLFVALVALRAIVLHARALAAQRFETSLVDGLRNRAWSALLHCDWRHLVQIQHSHSASVLISDINRIGVGVNQGISTLATGVTLAGVGIAGIAISPRIAIAAAASGVLVLFAYRRMRRKATELGERLGDAFRAIHTRITEGLGALRVIKSFGQEDRAAADLSEAFSALRTAERAYLRDVGLGQIALQGGGALFLAMVVWLGLTRWGAGATTILPLVALFARALPLLGGMQQSWQSWSHCRPAISATLSLIAEAEAGRESGDVSASAPQLADGIVFEGVTVRFPGRRRPALENVGVAVAARRITALTGPSGAGKSTLADLAGGLIGPDEGAVRIDGVMLEGAVRRAWRARVAYVQQEPVLFSGTIRDNLVWADPTASEARTRQALADASAQFVEALPDGINTIVGEGGRQLSGGERQRIVLARALLRDPDLLILDEATSALDRENEAAIAEAIVRLRDRLAILIICHRGELQALADCVITLEAGRVVATKNSSADGA